MYPDLDDIKREQQRIIGVKPLRSEELLESVALCRGFVTQSMHSCKNHGRHNWTTVGDLKRQCEQFIGRPMSDYAFAIVLLLGSKRRPMTQTIDLDRFNHLEVLSPPLDRFAEYREQWDDCQRSILEEVKSEIQRHPSKQIA
jgi:hypothetical protein